MLRIKDRLRKRRKKVYMSKKFETKKSIKVCLINPSTIDERKNASPLSTRNKYYLNPYNLSHIGLGYIAATLIENGFSCDIIESPVEGYNVSEIVELVLKKEYDVVGISSYYYNYLNTVRIVEKLKRRKNDIFIWLGGFLPTLCAKEILETNLGIDCCMVGEGEITTLELVDSIYNGEDWRKVNGVVYKLDNEIVVSPTRELITNLDVLPFPVRTYSKDRRIAAIVTSRGCYGHCNYCGIREFFNMNEGNCYRRRSPENVVEEIESLVSNQNVDYIAFNDGVFHICSENGRNWFDRFEKLIIEKNINVSFLCDFRVNEINKAPDIVQRFKQIGLSNVNIGIESFVQKQLNFYGKGVKVEENISAIKKVEEIRLNYTIGVLMFDPTITVEDVLEYCTTMVNMGYYDSDYNITRPLSVGSRVIATTGTPLYNYVIENNLYVENAYNYNFEDSRVEVLHKYVNKWSVRVSEIFNINYINYIAQDNNMVDEDKRIHRLFQKLFKLDQSYITDICKHILENGADETDEIWMKYEGKYIDELEIIEKELRGLEAELIKYY